jgi:hypothetical protein
MYGFHQVQLLSNMAIGIFTLRQQLRGLLSTNWPGAKTPYVEYLVVGGGGGGGRASGGGGAGGGVVTGLLPVTTGTSYTVTVGGGGAAGSSYGVAGVAGTTSVVGSVKAVGGGGGGAYNNSASAGGSGGGGSTGASSGSSVGAQGVFGQGNAGGIGNSGSPSITTLGAGGGGGAGTIGLNVGPGGTYGIGGNGGAGIASAINGTVTPYGGGGGGASGNPSGPGGTGGAGGGGTGGYGSSAAASPGQTNTGGGGGGDWNDVNSAGSGGSGIVIVSYPDIYPALTSTTGSPTVSTSGSGSLYLNNPSGAANQSLYYTSANATALGAGDFCIESFVWWSSSSGAAPYVVTNFSGSTNFLWGIYQQSSLSFYVYGGVNLNSATLFTNNTWNHLVVCRTSGTTSMFLNGTRVATASDSVTYTYSNLYVGQNGAGANFMNGYLSNLRIVVGNSIYSAAATTITVPTAPFTATSQTKFLLGTSSPNAFLDSSVSSLNPTLVSNSGSVSWNQLSPFATGLGYKNRVYTWSSTGSGAFTV